MIYHIYNLNFHVDADLDAHSILRSLQSADQNLLTPLQWQRTMRPIGTMPHRLAILCIRRTLELSLLRHVENGPCKFVLL